MVHINKRFVPLESSITIIEESFSVSLIVSYSFVIDTLHSLENRQ